MSNTVKGYIKLVTAVFLYFFIPIFVRIILKNNSVIIGMLLGSVILLLTLGALYYSALKEDFKIFKKDIKNNLSIGFFYWIIGLIIMYCLIFLFSKANIGQATNNEAVLNLIRQYNILSFIKICILTPIIEELVFRKAFYDAFKNKTLMVIISSIIFGLLHIASLEKLSEFLYLIPYSLMGVAFALTIKETKSIYPSIVFHAIHNTLGFVLEFI